MASGIGVSFLLENLEGIKSFAVTGEAEDALIPGQVFSLIHDAIQNRTPVGQRKVEGKRGLRKKRYGEHLQDKWVIDIEPNGRGATISTDVFYAPALEFGDWYPGVGPRTVATAGGIFSKQAPGGIIKPLIDDPKLFDKAIEQAVQTVNRRFKREMQKTMAINK